MAISTWLCLIYQCFAEADGNVTLCKDVVGLSRPLALHSLMPRVLWRQWDLRAKTCYFHLMNRSGDVENDSAIDVGKWKWVVDNLILD